MRLLLAGASGFIGKNLILKAPSEWEITGIYFKSTNFLDFLASGGIKNVQPLQCDLTSEEEVAIKFEKVKTEFDAAIFLVGNSDIGLSVRDPIFDLRANLISLINLLNNIKASRFIFMSSGTVYLGRSGQVSPQTAVSVDLPYGITKLSSELYIKYFCNRRKNIGEYAILRFFGTYGPMEPSRKIYTNLIKELYFNNKEEYLLRGDGKNLIDAMYITDATQGLFKVLTSERKGSITLDFCRGEPITVNELVERVAKILGRKVKIKHTNETSEYITFYSSPDKMAHKFGFRPRITLKEGILNFLDYMKTSQPFMKGVTAKAQNIPACRQAGAKNAKKFLCFSGYKG